MARSDEEGLSGPRYTVQEAPVCWDIYDQWAQRIVNTRPFVREDEAAAMAAQLERTHRNCPRAY